MTRDPLVPEVCGMSLVDTQMLMIKALDPKAHLEFSEYTWKWFVSSRLEICGDGVLTGIVEHCASPEIAVAKFLERLTTIPDDRRIALIYSNERREWLWNGAAFAEHPRMQS